MKRVGLTGGIATGKTTAGDILRQLGVPVIDADQLAREVVLPGTPTLATIVSAFGAECLDEGGHLDRQAMRKRISESPTARATLNAITHPAIGAQIATAWMNLSQDGHRAAVLEAALLVETGSHVLYPTLLVVTCDPTLQLERLMERDGQSREEALALIATQLPLAQKEALATHLILNNGTHQDLQVAVHGVWEKVLQA